MNKRTLTLLYTAVFIAATAILLLLLPREQSNKYIYEVNRPWAYQLLTAPFDIPIYLDTVSSQAIKDSINKNFEPIMVRDPEMEKERIDELSERLMKAGVHLSVLQRNRLREEIRNLYDAGIVDMNTYSSIKEGQIKGVRLLVDNMAKPLPSSSILSSKTAYNRLDSTVRAAGMHDALITSSLSEVLRPNLTFDSIENKRFISEAYQMALAPIGVVQQGERIIDKGDIVTPQLFTILQTFEQLAAARGAQIEVDRYYTLAGQTLYLMLLFASLYIYLYFFRPDYFENFRTVLFLMLMVTAFGAFAMVMPQNVLAGVYMIPFTIVIITTLVFLDSRTAFFTYLITVLIAQTSARFPVEFMMVEFVAGLVALVSIKDLSRRSQLLRTALFVFLTYCLTFSAMEMMLSGSLVRMNTKVFGGFAVNGVLISFAYVLIFVFEKLFGFTSKVTLVELCDINNPLLRELSEECPGTFQHSMAVSNLASVAARRIGANVQLVRAGALYHDIGKLGNPVFFTENQHGVNPHDGLDPRQSAAIVIGHVTEGLRRAEQAKLPQRIRDFITQHHGAGKAKYFYTTYCNAHPDENVDPKPFSYPGPNPLSKETSILMMADAVEAASRSLSDHSPQAINNLINKIIDSQIAEGLHNNSSLSFRDIQTIKEAFSSRLRGIYHARIQYPEDTRKNKQQNQPL